MAFMDWFKGATVPKDWGVIQKQENIQEIVEQSYQAPVAIFKHSTRCGISHAVFNHLIDDMEALSAPIKVYYLDLIQYRELSNDISRRFGVAHQSPQFIILQDGEVIHHSSHHAIQLQNILSELDV